MHELPHLENPSSTSPQPDLPLPYIANDQNMKRLFRSLSKRSLRKEDNPESDFVKKRDSLWDINENETWSYNRLKEDEAADAEQSSLQFNPQVSITEKSSDNMKVQAGERKPSPRKSYSHRRREEPELNPSPWTREKPSSSSPAVATDPLQSVYGSSDISFFGSQYGLGTNKAEELGVEYHDQMVEQVAALNFYEEMMKGAAPDIQRAASGRAETLWGNASKGVVENEISSGNMMKYGKLPDIQKSATVAGPSSGNFGYVDPTGFWKVATDDVLMYQPSGKQGSPKVANIRSTPKYPPIEARSFDISSSSSATTATPLTAPTSCIICTEDFTPTLSPPPYITESCTHPPSVCTLCLQKCISSDLTSKIWSKITCPECSLPLLYTDIQRLASPTDFTKYEELSLRSALSSDADFIWCPNQNCGFGQLHTTGEKQPIVRCLKCGFKSCFKHGVKWHERLSCEEYEEMMRDPRGFKSRIEREEEELKREEERQRRKHEEELIRARRDQEAEAQRRRNEEARRRQEEERRREEEERQKQREAIWKRQVEEQASLSTVENTTKRCPGCSWPIEKNAGCAHMTCTKCYHQFCWLCLKAWGTHRGSC